MTVRGIHRLFEDHVAQTPDAVAVMAGERRVSYRDLDASANALAHRLRARGITAGTLVGLLADRSVDMVTGILGILKAGAAYVPLNADYPVERLAFVAKDANLPLVVAAPPFAHLASTLGAPTLEFPGDHDTSDAPPASA